MKFRGPQALDDNLGKIKYIRKDVQGALFVLLATHKQNRLDNTKKQHDGLY
jgi:hypothetical protein